MSTPQEDPKLQKQLASSSLLELASTKIVVRTHTDVEYQDAASFAACREDRAFFTTEVVCFATAFTGKPGLLTRASMVLESRCHPDLASRIGLRVYDQRKSEDVEELRAYLEDWIVRRPIWLEPLASVHSQASNIVPTHVPVDGRSVHHLLCYAAIETRLRAILSQDAAIALSSRFSGFFDARIQELQRSGRYLRNS
ncbi:MAG: hypothetical protein WCV85_05555 [Patescibacteria group bacterium]|jgi:hypothetical protein